MKAIAQLSDHSTRDVTNVAIWDTSNPSLAVVTSAGLVTLVGPGEVDLRATYDGVTGSTHLRVSGLPQTLIVGGGVQESQPLQRALSGVVVKITGGPDAGSVATTDDAGFYRLTGLHPGRVTLQFSKEGFQTYQTSLTISQNTAVYAWLSPTPPQNSSGDIATARCNDGTWSWARSREDACVAHGGVSYTVCPGSLCYSQIAPAP